MASNTSGTRLANLGTSGVRFPEQRFHGRLHRGAPRSVRSWPPAQRCPKCHSDIAWKPSEGRGAVETFSIVRRPAQAEWKGKEPYVVAFIRLDDGGRILSNVVGCAAEDVRCGDRVTCRFVETTDPELGLPVFELEKSTA